MPEDTKVAVLEMGISTPGEMVRLAQLVRPHTVTITNICATHLEFLGTKEAVAREKLSLLEHAAVNAPLVINADDPLLVREASRFRDNPITFGINNPADVTPQSMQPGDGGAASVRIQGREFRLPLFGSYQVYNLLAAFATVRALGYDFDGVDTAAIELSTAPMRGEVLSVNGALFVLDCYNANPESVISGLRSFDSFPHTGRRIAVLGDMLELGAETEQYHREVGEALAASTVDLAVLVGPLARFIREEAVASGLAASRARYFGTAADCAARVGDIVQPGDLVYLKGSRGIGLEAVLEAWQATEENT